MKRRDHSTYKLGVFFTSNLLEECSLATKSRFIEQTPFIIYYLFKQITHNLFQVGFKLLFLFTQSGGINFAICFNVGVYIRFYTFKWFEGPRFKFLQI